MANSGLDRRLHTPGLPVQGGAWELPPAAARHAQVWRVQPGDALVLFDGSGAEWPATVTTMGRHSVSVQLGEPLAAAREPACAVTLALGMPAGDRMDALVEKATELGAAAVQPLHSARSVLRLAGERAAKRAAHWQAVAVAAAEQSGRTRVPCVAPVADASSWLGALAPCAADEARLLLSFAPHALAPAAWPQAARFVVLSGPEGGLTDAEEAAARSAGFVPASLGPRVLRADTAPLAALAWLTLRG